MAFFLPIQFTVSHKIGRLCPPHRLFTDSGVLAFTAEASMGIAMFIALAAREENVGIPASAAVSGKLPNGGLGA